MRGVLNFTSQTKVCDLDGVVLQVIWVHHVREKNWRKKRGLINMRTGWGTPHAFSIGTNVRYTETFSLTTAANNTIPIKPQLKLLERKAELTCQIVYMHN